MPTYEYVCANNHRTELMHGIHAPGPTACPVCGATMRKAFVAPTFVFKGSGWAKMDRRTAAAGRKSSSDSGSTGSDGDEAKPTSDTTAAASAGASAGASASASTSDASPSSASAPEPKSASAD